MAPSNIFDLVHVGNNLRKTKSCWLGGRRRAAGKREGFRGACSEEQAPRKCAMGAKQGKYQGDTVHGKRQGWGVCAFQVFLSTKQPWVPGLRRNRARLVSGEGTKIHQLLDHLHIVGLNQGCFLVFRCVLQVVTAGA